MLGLLPRAGKAFGRRGAGAGAVGLTFVDDDDDDDDDDDAAEGEFIATIICVPPPA